MSSLTGRLFGHYRILERVGRGGMATVYHADDRKSGRDVAIKFISPALAETEDFLKRFRREVKLVARLDHPNIVPVYDYGEQEGYAYLVMPYLPVGSLTDRMKQGSISLDEGGKLLDQVAAGLDYAHRHGIVHRDVKPSNVLLDGHGNALLGDFGLARSNESNLSLTGSALIGTPAYIAPEQVRGEQVDARCDQYALGVILFQLATGTLPFDAPTPMGLVLKHVSEPFPSARSRSANVPERVDRVILRATSKDPAGRFETVSEMNEALQAALAHLPDPSAHREPTIELPRAVVGARSGQVGGPPALLRGKRARRLPATRIAAFGAAVLLLGLALPVFASGLLGLLERAASPAEGGLEDSAALSAVQFTAQAEAIDAMSTQFASAAGSSMQPGEIETAVIETLTAQGDARAIAGDGPTAAPAFALAGDPGSPSPGAPSPTPPVGQTHTPNSTPASPVPPSPTPIPGSTAIPSSASQTPSLTATRTLTPSITPSATPSRTPTSTPSSTSSSPPPTATATTDPCPLLSVADFGVDGDAASWILNNGGSSIVTISRILLDWPAPNLELDRIRFDGSSIWNGTDDTPPSDIDCGWTGNRTLAAGSSKSLRFVFGADAQASGYDLQVYLDVGCQVPGGG